MLVSDSNVENRSFPDNSLLFNYPLNRFSLFSIFYAF